MLPAAGLYWRQRSAVPGVLPSSAGRVHCDKVLISAWSVFNAKRIMKLTRLKTCCTLTHGYHRRCHRHPAVWSLNDSQSPHEIWGNSHDRGQHPMLPSEHNQGIFPNPPGPAAQVPQLTRLCDKTAASVCALVLHLPQHCSKPFLCPGADLGSIK